MDDVLQCEDISFPQRGQKLFVSDSNYDETAQIGWKDVEGQFYGYISGYKEAADDVIRSALEKGKVGFGSLDKYVFPAVFLYRQYLELALKELYLVYSEETEDEKSKVIKACGHDLKKIWSKVKPIMSLGDSDPSISAVEYYVIEFAELDSSSYAFRYPIDKKLNLVHAKPKRINLRNLAERMNELAWFLECAGTELEVRQRDINEMRYYGFI